MMKRLNKKGFSIVEVVIAMTVIAIVSATALSIVASSSSNTSAAMYKADAQYLVYDALECFKVSQEEGDFYQAFENCRETLQKVEGTLDGYSGYQAYVLSDSQYIVLIKVTYAAAKEFTIIIQDTNKQVTVAQILNYRMP